MKLGFFTMPLHPVGRDWRRTLAEDREAILFAEDLGYEEAFIGEHVTDLAETITSCLIFIATLARDTTRIKLGSGTVNLANRHPAATAAEIAMVDTLLEGRFILGVGPGGLRSDAEMMDTLDADRTAMFVESIDKRFNCAVHANFFDSPVNAYTTDCLIDLRHRSTPAKAKGRDLLEGGGPKNIKSCPC